MNKYQDDRMEYRQYKRTIEELEKAKQDAEKARMTEKEAMWQRQNF